MPQGFRLLILASLTSPLLAGMPSFTLTDLWSMRVQSISFFLLVLLLSALGVKWLWNYLRRDFAKLPQLTYLRSLSLVILLGLLFMVVLTMISGARELMTPGAWKKQGATYALSAPAISEEVRRERIARLKTHLWRYADQHGGSLPPHDLINEISDEVWWADEARSVRYYYLAGAKRDGPVRPIAYEPRPSDGKRLVLMSDGVVSLYSDQEIITLLGDPR
jgi:hypothetical protein